MYAVFRAVLISNDIGVTSRPEPVLHVAEYLPTNNSLEERPRGFDLSALRAYSVGGGSGDRRGQTYAEAKIRKVVREGWLPGSDRRGGQGRDVRQDGTKGRRGSPPKICEYKPK